MEDRQAPVKEGQEYEVEIESVGGKGDGIAKVKGFVLFVAGTQKGDYVKVKVTKVLQNVGFAQLVQKLEKIKRRPQERKFATVRKEELEAEEEGPGESYEDTEDFGEEAEEKE